MISRYLHSIHLPHEKHTALSIPERLILPKTVLIPMSMHIGAPATILVKPGDHVNLGQKIGEANGVVSSPVHASVSGTVKKIESVLMANGAKCPAALIERDEIQVTDESVKVPVINTFEEFITAIKESGCVGLGGAGFPTHVKLNVDPKRVEYILINGAECEPYITSDTHTMVDNTPRIMRGIEEFRKFYPTAHIIIGIEKNKPRSIETLRKHTDTMALCDVMPLPSTYPQGGEKSLIYNTIHRIIPEGKLPIDVGCIVINATTVSFIGKYLMTGMPLTTKCITVDGSAVKKPQNVIVPVGMLVSDILTAIGGPKKEIKKALSGGPMMGIALPNLDIPILKYNNAVLLFAEEDSDIPTPTDCIHCGLCVKACPMNLAPTLMEEARIKGDVEALRKYHVNLCIECGSCAYICPAKRNLTESHKLSKIMLKEANVK